MGETPAAVPVVLVGDDERAAAWREVARRSPRLTLVGSVAAAAGSGDDLERCDSIEAAAARWPRARFAVAAGPRLALENALAIAAQGAAGVVAVPLHSGICDIDLGEGASRVAVAHGWLNLPGRAAVSRMLEKLGGGRMTLEVAGAADGSPPDPLPAVIDALALVRALVPAASIAEVEVTPGGYAWTLSGGPNSWTSELRLRLRGCRVALRAQAEGRLISWVVDDRRETIAVDGKAVVDARPVAAASVRALGQLLVPQAGIDLPFARDVALLVRESESRLARRIPHVAAPLAQAAAVAEREPGDPLAALGLRGELDDADAAVPVCEVELPPEPFELWAFRAGIKPVAFLTVLPDEVERTLAWFGDVHCERRDRRVQVAAQDRWQDRRDLGEQRVELYLSRDPELARRAAYLQAEVDPSKALREIGELVGYPSCCVEAFAAQDDRSNNSLNRYLSWSRTAPQAAAWPWQLNNLHTMVAPFYPCSYRCSAALAWAAAALDELDKAYPRAVGALRRALGQPLLYFDHERQVVFDGVANGATVSFGSLSVPGWAPPAFRRFAAVLARGDRLNFGDREVTVERAGEAVARFTRTDPGLGFVAPFAAG